MGALIRYHRAIAPGAARIPQYLQHHLTYNTTWLIERHGFVSPATFRQQQVEPAALAA